MPELFSIMLDVIVPIFLVIGAGFIIGKNFDPDPRGLSVFLIYLFVPALVFRGIYETELTGGEIGGIGVVVLGVSFVMLVINTIVARWLKLSARQEGAFALTVILMNAANYGIPLNTFAFGDEGRSAAIVYYVMSAMLGNIVGVYFASKGSSSGRDSMLNVLRVPIVYAALLGFAFNYYDVELPQIIRRSVIEIAAGAAIPGMLALLGLQLSRVSLRQKPGEEEDTLSGQIFPILLASGFRLLLGPVVALGLALLIGLNGITFNVAILQSSMPTAVLASALATQFNSDARFVSAVTLVSTLASLVTLSILISLLGGTVT